MVWYSCPRRWKNRRVGMNVLCGMILYRLDFLATPKRLLPVQNVLFINCHLIVTEITKSSLKIPKKNIAAFLAGRS
jgi:hypothetical protein